MAGTIWPAAPCSPARTASRARTSIEQQIAQLAGGLAQQNEDITKLQTKLADAKSRQQTLAARRTTAGNRIKVREKLHDERINDAFFRFEAAERTLDQMEGRVEAYDLGRTATNGRAPTLEEELAGLEIGPAAWTRNWPR